MSYRERINMKNLKIDLNHLHHWMNAIRISDSPSRTLDSFWSGQMRSKEWLLEELSDHISSAVDIDIYGGWNGVLASMIFQSSTMISNIRSIDIDPTCEKIAVEMNRIEYCQGRFQAVTADMCVTPSIADIVINTSCEHVTQAQYDKWLSLMPDDALIVLQSNNYDIPEHIRSASDIEEFIKQSNLKYIKYSGSKEFPLYTRHMIMGYIH